MKHDTGEAIEGVLWSSRGPWLVLRDAAALKGGHPPAKLFGDVVIPRSNVAYLQVLE